MRTIYAILVEHCMKWTPLSGLMGGNYYKTVEKAYNLLLKSSRKLTNSLLLIRIQLSRCDRNTPLKIDKY